MEVGEKQSFSPLVCGLIVLCDNKGFAGFQLSIYGAELSG
jgi:hypothetical protein